MLSPEMLYFSKDFQSKKMLVNLLSMKLVFPLVFCLLISNAYFAQNSIKDSVFSRPWISAEYGGNWTSGDLADRYGFMNHIGIMAGYKTKKNYFFGMESCFHFGNDIRLSGLFDHLVDSYGNITDENGDIAVVLVYPRGFSTNIAIGKIFPVFGSNKNSGLFIHGGIGYLWHYMKIETNNHVIPQIELEYKKGYDRLTTGINLHQFVGYNFMSNSGSYHFYGGFYAQEGFTKNRRTIFYDQPEIPVSTELRLDVQIGFKLGWVIPIYKRQPKDFYFN